MRKNILSGLLYSSVLSLGLASCEKDLQFSDPSALSKEDALAIKGAALKLGNSSVVNVLDYVYNGATGVHFLLLADQITSTNRAYEFWDWSQEPRKAITNSDTYGGYGVLSDHYTYFYQANLDANLVLQKIRKGEKITDAQGVDRTADALTAAYFSKGVAQGYLGALYDRGIIIDNADVTSFTDFSNSYKELITNGIKYLDSAISSAGSNSNFNFDFIPGQTVSKADFIAFSNSLAARILAATPRDLAEAKALGSDFWNKVYAYASKGLTADLLNSYVTDGFYHGTLDWTIFRLGDGSGYLPVDIKVPYLADNTGTYPNYYPSTGILGPVSTSDARFSSYFGYTTNFGYLRADRNRGLFSNYYRIRWDNAANTTAEPGAVSPLFQAEEVRYLQAEAKLFAGDAATAAAILNNAGSNRKSLGHLPDVAAVEDSVRKALFYEYSIEIDAAGGVLPVFAFERRNNKLIGGTPTEIPLPSQQLNALKLDVYTFGGTANFGAKGKYNEVSTAANTGWKASQ